MGGASGARPWLVLTRWDTSLQLHTMHRKRTPSRAGSWWIVTSNAEQKADTIHGSTNVRIEFFHSFHKRRLAQMILCSMTRRCTELFICK